MFWQAILPFSSLPFSSPSNLSATSSSILFEKWHSLAIGKAASSLTEKNVSHKYKWHEHSHHGVFSLNSILAIRVSGFVKWNPHSHYLQALFFFRGKNACIARLLGTTTAFVRAVILKRILGKSIEHCGSEACVRAHHVNKRLERRERFVFLINESFQAKNKREEMDFFFLSRRP